MMSESNRADSSAACSCDEMQDAEYTWVPWIRRAGAWLLTAGACFFAAAQAEAIITADSAGTHATTPGQPFTRQNSPPLDVDGVVQIITNAVSPTGQSIEYLGTGALISDRFVLTAAHVLAITNFFTGDITQQIDLFGTDNKVRFDLPEGQQFVPIVGVSLHPNYSHPGYGYDLAVIELAKDAPAAAPRYPIYSRNDELAQPMVKVGYGESGWGNDTPRNRDAMKRAGFNSYDAGETYWTTEYSQLGLVGIPTLPEGTGLVYDFDSGLPQHDGLGSIGAPGLHFGMDEVFPSTGDSGSPGFLYDRSTSTYKVAGVTSFSTSVFTDANHPFNDATFGETAVDTRASAFTSFIQNVVAGTVPTLKARALYDGGQWVAGANGQLDHHVLRINDSATGIPTNLEIQQGAIIGTGNSLPAVFGVEVLATSVLRVSGGEVTGNLLGVLASDSSRFELYDGMIKSTHVNTRAIELGESSTAEIHGGTVFGKAVGVQLFGDASLMVTGGSITGESTAGIAIGPGTAATVTIKGGSVSGGIEDLINNSPQSSIRIFGRQGSFNLPVGEVSAESGTITGLFADGTPFDFSFFRGGGGIIELVEAGKELPGDYDRNGAVDAADYVVWRNELGVSRTQADYNVWRAHFGLVASGKAADAGAINLPSRWSTSAAALPAIVPEPSATSFMWVGVLMITALRKRDLAGVVEQRDAQKNVITIQTIRRARRRALKIDTRQVARLVASRGSRSKIGSKRWECAHGIVL